MRWFVILAAGFMGLPAGWWLGSEQSVKRLDRVVVMSWGDHTELKALYGAHVYLEPLDVGYSVRAQVMIGRGGGYVHELGELGKVATDAEAVARWGQVQWSADGLRIGSGSDTFFLPRERLERHR